MNISVKIILSFLLVVGSSISLNAGTDKKPQKSKSKAILIKENNAYKITVDSLMKELAKYKNELKHKDSLNNEMLEIYVENENKTGAGLEPQDYSLEVTDSLLSIWYHHKQINNSDEGTEYIMDSVQFKSDVPDEVFIDRIAKMNSFITLPFNETVKNYIILYSEKMPQKMAHILGLSNYYMPIFEEIFNKYGMPEELKMMAVIESSLNPIAVSKANAKGMWQFMYRTGKTYGLEINSFVDERLDPIKSADAAARYLMDAYMVFGDWNLAISSYNCGLGNVNKAIRRSGGKKDFWSIYRYLPRETRGYVPAFVGALYATTYYKEHGIIPENVLMPAHVDTFQINKMLHFKQINELVGVPMETLKNLNPQYIHGIIPGNEKEYILRIPFNYTNAFIEQEDSLYTYKASEYFNPAVVKNLKESNNLSSYITYRVRKGDYLGKIASRFGLSVVQLKRWNHIKGNNIRTGQRLHIYRDSVAPKVSSNNDKNTGNDFSGEYIIYIVRKGDSLYKIAQKYPGVNASDIMAMNGVGANLKPGMKLKIPKR